MLKYKHLCRMLPPLCIFPYISTGGESLVMTSAHIIVPIVPVSSKSSRSAGLFWGQ